MQPKRLGELLLVQVMKTWNERELEYCESGKVYFMAQLLRSMYFSNQEVELSGDEATMEQVAAVVEKLDPARVPSYWRNVLSSGIHILRNPTRCLDLVNVRLDLKAEYPADQWFPDPLQA
ncbi:MAG: hypothetical protein Q8R25_03305 [bacterium]|nr:hypothetical protein [bacterium]